MNEYLRIALHLATVAVPVLPLRAGKLPFGNCRRCADNACGGRPNMKTAGACECPAPCHGWAAATTHATVLTSRPWAGAWREARAVAYHPGGAGVTVVDLDSPEAAVWARESLPRTRTVPTTRGEHWIYQGVMRGANNVRPGVDIKSLMAYVRWLGPGTGVMTALPDAVRALTVKERPVAEHGAAVASVPVSAGGVCRHRTPAYLERGIAMAEGRITDARSAVHTTVYRVFLAVLSTHGRCGCLTEAHVQRLFLAAQAKGESARHCAIAWANARTALGV
ncbi:bifunctional DNA primase/polymerase [Streptomyces sp. NBC_00838]|uniref:bifunctional DNA primase/polymerase n=1 Tax=Streptomyces sp. NBC_00838 TaxID=2903680 RepID=UPI00386B654C|nr:bifunctional DNA primase/polymerase [Streptomyces sp. NBC_00838]